MSFNYLNADERRAISRLGGLSVQAKYGGEIAARARRGLLAKFEEQVDPDHRLPADVRESRARSLRRNYMAGLARRRHSK